MHPPFNSVCVPFSFYEVSLLYLASLHGDAVTVLRSASSLVSRLVQQNACHQTTVLLNWTRRNRTLLILVFFDFFLRYQPGDLYVLRLKFSKLNKNGTCHISIESWISNCFCFREPVTVDDNRSMTNLWKQTPKRIGHCGLYSPMPIVWAHTTI